MGLFTRKSKAELVMEGITSAIAQDGVKRIGKVAGGAIAGLFSVTALSAIISASRHQGQQS
jgi:hypothetical protein